MNRQLVIILGIVLVFSSFFGTVYADGPGEHRGNSRANDEDPDNATAISPGDTKTDTVSADTDVDDWYVANLPNSRVIRVNLTLAPGGDFDLYIYNEELTAYVAASLGWGAGGYEECIFGTKYAGDYYIRINAYEGDGSYTLKLFNEGAYVDDGDNDPGNATAINMDDSDNGELDKNGADGSDWYSISLNIGDVILVELGVAETGDFNIYLWDDLEAWWPAAESENPGLGVDEMFGFEAEEAGIFYIVTSAREGEGAYTISVTELLADDNDDANNADDLTLPIDEDIEGLLVTGMDGSDYYTIYLEENDIVDITLSYEDTNEFDLYLLDTDEDEIDMSNTSSGIEEISYTAENDGWYLVLVQLTDGSGYYTLAIDFTPGNLPPAITSFSPIDENLIVNEGENVHFEIEVDDEDIPALQYEWYVDNVKETGVDGDELFINTTFNAEYSAGDYEIIVEVSDEDFIVSLSWNLTVTDVNQLPQIEIKEPVGTEITINETESISFEIDVTDADGTDPEIQWFLDGLEQEDEDDEEFEFETDHAAAGIYMIKVNVTDGANESLVNFTSWTVTVLNKDRAPELSNQTPRSKADTDEVTPFTFSLDAIDLDSDEITYKWYFDNRIDDSDGNSYTFVPDYDSADGESHEVKVVVTAGGLSANYTWKLTIDNINRKPTIDNKTLMPDLLLTYQDGEEIEFFIFAKDPDGDNLTYTWQIVGTGDKFTEQVFKHKLKGGTYTVKITVEDGNGGSDTYQFTLEVEKEKSSESPGFGIGATLAVLGCLFGLFRYAKSKR